MVCWSTGLGAIATYTWYERWVPAGQFVRRLLEMFACPEIVEEWPPRSSTRVARRAVKFISRVLGLALLLGKFWQPWPAIVLTFPTMGLVELNHLEVGIRPACGRPLVRIGFGDRGGGPPKGLPSGLKFFIRIQPARDECEDLVPRHFVLML